MTQRSYHLAQVNIARANAPMDDPIMAVFANRLDEINALADAAPGFVWRLQGEDGNATAIQVFEDPMLLINMSVWESIETLEAYTYKTLHVELIRGRKQWFTPPDGPHMALWWIPAGTIPTPEDAKRALAHLAEHGPSPSAFTFRERFDPPQSKSDL